MKTQKDATLKEIKHLAENLIVWGFTNHKVIVWMENGQLVYSTKEVA